MTETKVLSSDALIRKGFGQTNRYIGPFQKLVTSWTEIVSNMYAQSGIIDAFVSVYPISPNFERIIDKVFLERDSGTLKENLKTGQVLFEEITEKYNLPAIAIWSGNKSPHIFPLFKPTLLRESKETLHKTALQIVEDAEEFEIDPFIGKCVPNIDTKVLEPRRLCRFPGPRRVQESGIPSMYHCVILDPNRFLDMDLKEVLEISMNPSDNSFKTKFTEPKIKITDFETKINLEDWSTSAIEMGTEEENYFKLGKGISSNSDFVQRILEKLIIRPCNKKWLSYSNPPHRIRFSSTAELLNKGIDKDFTKYIFSLLEWYDYDPIKTSDFVDSIYRNKSFPTGFVKMEREGFCIFDENNYECKICKGLIKTRRRSILY